jgi:pyruvate dehydrogenase E1 component alpha subunit
MSAVWDLPVVWLIENNQYGMGTAVNRASGQEELVKRAISYGMKQWERIDGMNVVEVHEEISKALDYARKNGPVLVESLTYRFQGHSMGDPERYRSKDEIAKYQEGDPIGSFRAHLTSEKNVKVSELDKIEEQVLEEMEAVQRFAEESPLPSMDTLYDNIYVDDLERG